MLDGDAPIPKEMQTKRRLPLLNGDYQFSVISQVEIQNIDKAADRNVISRLRDDLITNQIPKCKTECKRDGEEV